jgi:hypothetical protein
LPRSCAIDAIPPPTAEWRLGLRIRWQESAQVWVVVIWLMASGRSSSHRAERRAQQLIAASFVVLAAYVAFEALRDLLGGHHPAVSWVGVGLSAVTLLTMPPLAAAKRRVAEQLESSATASESRQTMLCAYLSAGLLVGLLANALVGWASFERR